ncbi:hypothetical protein N0V90_000680 [Kalmusia sp. IMI 367209]|nr:hypothetical protein N0V90_000680 [Kalmusia sp. IMI 367209]
MVALQCIKLEEGMDPGVELGSNNWLPLTAKCKDSSDVEERKRVQDVFVSVNMADRQIGVNLSDAQRRRPHARAEKSLGP